MRDESYDNIATGTEAFPCAGCASCYKVNCLFERAVIACYLTVGNAAACGKGWFHFAVQHIQIPQWKGFWNGESHISVIMGVMRSDQMHYCRQLVLNIPRRCISFNTRHHLSTLFEAAAAKLGIWHKLVRFYMGAMAWSGAVVREDQKRFCSTHLFYSLDDFAFQLACL